MEPHSPHDERTRNACERVRTDRESYCPLVLSCKVCSHLRKHFFRGVRIPTPLYLLDPPICHIWVFLVWLFGTLLCLIWVLWIWLFGAHFYLGALDFASLEIFFLSVCSGIRLISALIRLSGRSEVYFLSTCFARPFSC